MHMCDMHIETPPHGFMQKHQVCRGGGCTHRTPSLILKTGLYTQMHKSMPPCIHTHGCTLTVLPLPLPPPFVLSASLSVQTRRQDVFFFFLFFFSLNKNNLLSDVGSLIVVTGPKLKCGLIKACVCVWVCAHVLLTLIRPINSLSVTKSALAARQTQLPVKSVLLLLGLPEQCLDVCHGSNRNQAKLRLF